MGTLLGLIQLVAGTAGYHIVTVLNKITDESLQIQKLRTPLHQCNIVYPKGGLHGRVFVEVIQHDIGNGISLQINDNAHTVTIRLIVHVRYAFNLLIVDQVGYFNDELGLIHQIRNLRNNYFFSSVTVGLNVGLRAHNYTPSARFITVSNTLVAVDVSACRKVRRLNDVHQGVYTYVVVINVGNDGIDRIHQVVWRHIGGHTYCNTRSSVDQQKRNAGGQHGRFL